MRKHVDDEFGRSCEVHAKTTNAIVMRMAVDEAAVPNRTRTKARAKAKVREARAACPFFSIIQKNVPTRAAEGARKGSKWQRSRWLPTDFLTCNEWIHLAMFARAGMMESSTSDIFFLIFHDRTIFD